LETNAAGKALDDLARTTGFSERPRWVGHWHESPPSQLDWISGPVTGHSAGSGSVGIAQQLPLAAAFSSEVSGAESDEARQQQGAVSKLAARKVAARRLLRVRKRKERRRMAGLSAESG
jgi:hypothetical protein